MELTESYEQLRSLSDNFLRAFESCTRSEPIHNEWCGSTRVSVDVDSCVIWLADTLDWKPIGEFGVSQCAFELSKLAVVAPSARLHGKLLFTNSVSIRRTSRAIRSLQQVSVGTLRLGQFSFDVVLVQDESLEVTAQEFYLFVKHKVVSALESLALSSLVDGLRSWAQHAAASTQSGHGSLSPVTLANFSVGCRKRFLGQECS